MFGEDGWCHSCGVTLKPQTGSMILQRKGLAKPEGAWLPYFKPNAICLDRSLAEKVRERFQVELLEVHWPSKEPDGPVWQMVIPTVGSAWFPTEELRERAIAYHGTDGQRCADCGVWRWMPLFFEQLPPVQVDLTALGVDVAACPEWFGDGHSAFHLLLMRRELAELIATASPRDFTVVPVAVTDRPNGAH